MSKGKTPLSLQKQKIQEKQTRLLELTHGFCQKYLDKNYSQLCQTLIHTMSLQQKIPFLSGKLEIWAASIIQALGQVNFLFDKNCEPYVSLATLNKHFGTTQSTVMNKARELRHMLDRDDFNQFAGQELLEKHSLENLVALNGRLVTIGTLPQELQYLVQQMGLTELETIAIEQDKHTS